MFPLKMRLSNFSKLPLPWCLWASESVCDLARVHLQLDTSAWARLSLPGSGRGGRKRCSFSNLHPIPRYSTNPWANWIAYKSGRKKCFLSTFILCRYKPLSPLDSMKLMLGLISILNGKKQGFFLKSYKTYYILMFNW